MREEFTGRATQAGAERVGKGPGGRACRPMPETEWQDEPQQLELFDRDDSSV